MRAARLTAMCLAIALWAPSALASSATHGAATVVGTDGVGDWGSGPTDQIGDGLGEDLTAAAIRMEDPKTIGFVIHVHTLPSVEAPDTTYNWPFEIGKTFWQLDSGCASQDACTPGSLTFRVISCSYPPLAAGLTMRTCDLVQRVTALLDPSAGTITIPVSTASLRAHSGTSIDPAPRTGTSACGQILVYSGDTITCATGAPDDAMDVTGSFRIP